MTVFSERSLAELETALPILQKAAHIVVRIKDHSIIKGFRGEREQNEAFAAGFSKLPWPDGKHNELPCRALDVQTYPVPDTDEKLFREQCYLLGLYVGVLHMLGHKARTGIDWDTDGELSDNGWNDAFHIEVIDDDMVSTAAGTVGAG